jgi:hypothetical protein
MIFQFIMMINAIINTVTSDSEHSSTPLPPFFTSELPAAEQRKTTLYLFSFGYLKEEGNTM